MIWDITFKQMSSSSGSAPDIPPFFTSNTEWHPVRVLATEHWRFVAKALPPSEASGCWCCCVVCSPTALRLLSASDSKLSVQIRGPSFFPWGSSMNQPKKCWFHGIWYDFMGLYGERRFHGDFTGDVDISQFTTRWGPLPNVYLVFLLSTKDSWLYFSESL